MAKNVSIAALTLIMLFVLNPPGAFAGDGPTEIELGDAFWSHWGDGQAELAGYDLSFPRYGSPRSGVAVTIFVTEPFSFSSMVKADPGKHPASDVFQVMKLNLVRDFPTGIYDYNMMTSTFVGLQPFKGSPSGSLAKVSFSSQEWCGHVYQQILFRGARAEITAHSYFDGEADSNRTVSVPEDGISEDLLFHWARGFARPVVGPGEEIEISILPSLTRSRLGHRDLEWSRATLSSSEATESLEVGAGTFDVRTKTVRFSDGRSTKFFVEPAPPHRIIRWESSDGEVADLVGVERLAYWKMNGPEFTSAVEKLGLRPRGDRMP